MVATNDDILKALQDINDTLKLISGVSMTQEQVKTQLLERATELK